MAASVYFAAGEAGGPVSALFRGRCGTGIPRQAQSPESRGLVGHGYSFFLIHLHGKLGAAGGRFRFRRKRLVVLVGLPTHAGSNS